MKLPPQHGAWAFTVIPLVVGFVLVGFSLPTLLLALAWVGAYPTSYFSTQALATRIRRGEWNTRAKRQLREALPWKVITSVFVLALVIIRPGIIIPGVGLILLWLVSVLLTARGRERAFSNDLLLVAMAAAATPLMQFVAHPSQAIPDDIWLASLIMLIFFTGSVIHVKSLIREADDRRWRVANLVFHTLALGTAQVGPWLLVVFVPALIRSVVLKPKTPPIRIGLVEIAVSVLLLVALVVVF